MPQDAVFRSICLIRYLLPDGFLPVVVKFVSPPSRRSSRSFRFASQGFQVVIRDVNRLARILLTCYVRLLTFSILSVTFAFSLTQMIVFLSRYVTFNTFLSIFVCAATSLFFAWVLSAHVSAPYVITGSTHEFKHVYMLHLKLSRYLANVVHPAVILL